MHTELGEDGLDMMPHRVWADVELVGNIPVRRVPTLVVHGRDDRIVKLRAARHTASMVAAARLLVYPGVTRRISRLRSDSIVIWRSLCGRYSEGVVVDDIEPAIAFFTVLRRSREGKDIGDPRASS